jgi:hypothetical protein
MTSHFPSIWKRGNVKSPWNLPVVYVSGEGKAQKVHDNVVENAAFCSLDNKSSPGFFVCLPWPWGILLNLVLFKESILSSVNEPVEYVETQNHSGSHGANIKGEELCLGKFIALWQPSAGFGFLFGDILNLIGLNLTILNVRSQTAHNLGPDIFSVTRKETHDEIDLKPGKAVPKSVLGKPVIELSFQDQLDINCRLFSVFVF